MKITVELSLYPLTAGDPIERVIEFIAALRADARVEVTVNQMSTQLCGEFAAVMEVLQAAMQQSFAAGYKQALVAKFLNVDLPLGEAPVLGHGERAE
jgi:uncharacterized protein YqgV (UPF0045/DUF77 family)